MAALLPASALGLYAVAVAWSASAAPLLNAIGVVTAPAVASAADAAHSIRRLSAATRSTVLLAIILCLLLAAATPVAISLLFGDRFRASVPAALALIPAAGILGVNLVLQEGLLGMGQPYAVLQAELAGLAVTAPALALMLYPLGIVGAAIASLCGYSTVTVFLVHKVKQHTGISATSLLLPNVRESGETIGRLITMLPRLGS
jgi:O-antigen/teichoic acid export membrane protein